MKKRSKRIYKNSKLYIPDLNALNDRDNPDFEKEWSTLYNTFKPVLYRWYLSMRNMSQWDAEEMLSLSMERIFVYIHKYNKVDGSLFHSWVLRVGHNVMIDYLKSKNNKDTVVYEENTMDKEYVQHIDEVIDFEIKMRFIEKDIPKSYSRPFILKEVYGLNNEEIAKTLGVSVDVIPMRLSRARAYIRKQLKTFK